MIRPIIMCGGSGIRLWPLSRDNRPKQFLSFGTQHTLFQETVLRVSDPIFDTPIIIAGLDHRFIVADQLLEIGIDAEILLEPERRDSCAAIVAATAHVLNQDSAVSALVLAADHVMTDPTAFRDHVRWGLQASRDNIVTFGIVPDYPATAYGYIEPGTRLSGDEKVRAAHRFVEKPDEVTAAAYVSEGYLWNSGNFLFSGEMFLEEAMKYAPKIAGPARLASELARAGTDFVHLDPDAFRNAEAKSIDYAIIEKSEKVAVLPSDFPWSDVGSWSAVRSVNADNDQDNVTIGSAEFQEAKGNLVHANDDRLVTLVGVDNLAVVSTDDALLVTDLSKSEQIKPITEKLRTVRPDVVKSHRKAYHPWGHFEQIESGDGYLVKRIVVKPSGILSLQSHEGRAEHWVVVAGVARATIEQTVTDLSPDQSIYIAKGAIHRLENPGETDLILIEIQIGADLREDDIVRYEDVYGRT